MTQYPYYISSSISTATTHSQYYQLAMEEDSNHDGTNDIVVWFLLNHKVIFDYLFKSSYMPV